MRSMNGGQNGASRPSTSANLDGPGGGSSPSRMRTTHTAIVMRSMGSSGQKAVVLNPPGSLQPVSTPSATSRPTASA